MDKSCRDADGLFFYEEELELPVSNQQSDIQISYKNKIVDKTIKILEDNDIQYVIDKNSKKDFIDGPPSLIDRRLAVTVYYDDVNKLCSYLNKELADVCGHVKRDVYNTLFIYYDSSLLKESVMTEDLKSAVSGIKSKIKNKYEGKSRDISKVEAKLRFDILPDSDIALIKQNIQKINAEAIKLFNGSELAYGKDKFTKHCKITTNTKIIESYSSIITEDNGYCTIRSVPVSIKVTNKDISKKDLKIIESTIWDYLDDKINGYIKSLNLKFNIYASPETHNCDSPTPEFLLCVEYQNTIKKKKKSSIKESETLSLPSKLNDDLQTILDNTDEKRIYLTSDWHLFQTHYKKEHNYVNTQDIVSWCKKNIKDDDVFMYLGDISYRWCNEEDQKESMKIMSSLPGIKILIAGNHDRMLGDEYLYGCGFDYIFDEYTWKNFVFTHRPINMTLYPEEFWNIHGHLHKWQGYNTTDGKKNINVYPWYYDNKPVTLDYIIKHKEELVKDNYYNPNDILSETKRSNLPDSSFGIPEDRKYPLDTEQHVKSAIKLFGHAEESKKKKLAKNIRAAASKYDITIPENTQCYKYLSEGGIETIIPGDITNVIFDMGGVLVNNDMHKAIDTGLRVKDYVAHKIYDFYEDNLFCTNEKRIDLYDVQCMKEYVRAIAPDYVLPYIDEIFDLMNPAMYVYTYTYELLSILKKKGYSIYYLSNWPKWAYELEKNFFAPLLDKFDGGLFSFGSRYYMKPDKEFYLEFLREYELNPETCIFFDDKPENIEAAEEVGIKGVLFNSIETPKILLDDNIMIPSDANNTVLIDIGSRLESVSLDKFNSYSLSSDFNPKADIYKMHDNIADAIDDLFDTENITEDIDKYVFASANDSIIPIGQIIISPNKSYKWQIQYPLQLVGDNNVISLVKEWSMASCNPICGVHKPFILQMKSADSMFSPIRYAFSPDIISDKYLVIDENAQLSIIDSSSLSNHYIEAYEFIGNKANIGKIYNAYKQHKIVDNTVFYTMLTGKPMLCEDQIDFDNNFKKIDFEFIQEKAISECASFREGLYLYSSTWKPIMEMNISTNLQHTVNKYNKYGDIFIREDLDGYYVYSNMTKKRTASVNHINEISDAMVRSIL